MNFLDRAINWVSPKWGAEREAYRNAGALQAASYSGAYPTRISVPFQPSESVTGVPALTYQAARNMRDRARQLINDNPLASSILYRATENVVGHGFRLQSLSADTDWNKRAEELMGGWFPTADFYGRTWQQHQKLVCNGLLRDGDLGGLLLSRGQVQIVEGDYITSNGKQAESFLHDGLELNQYGQISKFWIKQWVDFKNPTWKQISPKDFIFIANLRRSHQYRGETYFAQSFDLFEQIDGYINAVVLAQKIAACLAVFVKSQNPTAGLAGLKSGKNAQGDTQRKWHLEPGMIQTLLPGEDIEQITPQQPGTVFSENLRTLLRLLGLNFGLPIELVFLDFSQTNYSSAKASLLQAQRTFEGIQQLLIDAYYSRIYRWRISKFINEGLLEERPDAFNHSWHPEPWPYLDPVKEIQAALLAIDAGLDTERRAIMARGRNPDHIMTERATELAAKRAAQIPIYHTALTQEILPQEETAPTTPNEEKTPNTGYVADANATAENQD